MKRPIILLHGALGSKDQFNELSVLLNEDFDVHLLNFSGHGDQPTSLDFSMTLFAQNVLEYIAQHELTKPNILGYSMGGYVALKLASNHADKIGSIMTLATKFDWTPETAAREIKMLNPEKIAEKVPHFRAHLIHTHSAETWAGVVSKTADLMYDLANGDRLTGVELNGIANLVMIAVGDEDKMVSLDESEKASKQLRNAHIKVLPGQVHQIERMDQVLLQQEIKSFFSN